MSVKLSSPRVFTASMVGPVMVIVGRVVSLVTVTVVACDGSSVPTWAVAAITMSPSATMVAPAKLRVVLHAPELAWAVVVTGLARALAGLPFS